MKKEEFQDILDQLKIEYGDKYICPLENIRPNRNLPTDHPQKMVCFFKWDDPQSGNERKIPYTNEEKYRNALTKKSKETGEEIKWEVWVRGYFTKEFDNSFVYKNLNSTKTDNKTLIPEDTVIDSKALYDISVKEKTEGLDILIKEKPDDLAKRWNKTVLEYYRKFNVDIYREYERPYREWFEAKLRIRIDSEEYKAIPLLYDEQPEKETGEESEKLNLKNLYKDLHDVQKLAVNYLGELGENGAERIKDMVDYIDKNSDFHYGSDRVESVFKLFRGSITSKYFYENELVKVSRGKYKLRRPIDDYTG